MATKTTKQIKAQLINEVARSYKDKIKRLTDKNTQLCKSNYELINKNGILNEKVQELEEKLSQYEDWNRRLQEFMDMSPDEREKSNPILQNTKSLKCENRTSDKLYDKIYLVVMATRKFIIEMEEGKTMCHQCPLQYVDCFAEMYDILDCSKYNLTTMKIKELE